MAPCLTDYLAYIKHQSVVISAMPLSSIDRMQILLEIGWAVFTMRRRVRLLGFVMLMILFLEFFNYSKYTGKFGDFFPVTGHIKDIEVAAVKNYALNVPLNDGLNDQNFRSLFCPVIQKVMKVYQLDVVL